MASVYDREKWKDKAKCAGMDTEMWYPPRDKNLYKPIADTAKAICFGRDAEAACPVRIDCLLYAENNEEQYGIWGGMSTRERNALRRKAAAQGKTLAQYLGRDNGTVKD